MMTLATISTDTRHIQIMVVSIVVVLASVIKRLEDSRYCPSGPVLENE